MRAHIHPPQLIVSEIDVASFYLVCTIFKIKQLKVNDNVIWYHLLSSLKYCPFNYQYWKYLLILMFLLFFLWALFLKQNEVNDIIVIIYWGRWNSVHLVISIENICWINISFVFSLCALFLKQNKVNDMWSTIIY